MPDTVEKGKEPEEKKLVDYNPEKGDKPPLEDIPKALEHKLDVIISHLRRE